MTATRNRRPAEKSSADWDRVRPAHPVKVNADAASLHYSSLELSFDLLRRIFGSDGTGFYLAHHSVTVLFPVTRKAAGLSWFPGGFPISQLSDQEVPLVARALDCIEEAAL